MLRPWQFWVLALSLAFCWTVPSLKMPAQAQVVQSPVLTIDSERLFRESDFGRRAAREIEEQGAALASENRRIEAELTEEERQLTERRPSLNPVEFRDLADAFDEKVQTIRREQDSKTRALNQQIDENRQIFLNAAAPVLEQLMRDAGASVVLERGSVFISSTAVDITDAAVTRINDVLGAGDSSAGTAGD